MELNLELSTTLGLITRANEPVLKVLSAFTENAAVSVRFRVLQRDAWDSILFGLLKASSNSHAEWGLGVVQDYTFGGTTIKVAWVLTVNNEVALASAVGSLRKFIAANFLERGVSSVEESARAVDAAAAAADVSAVAVADKTATAGGIRALLSAAKAAAVPKNTSSSTEVSVAGVLRPKPTIEDLARSRARDPAVATRSVIEIEENAGPVAVSVASMLDMVSGHGRIEETASAAKKRRATR